MEVRAILNGGFQHGSASREMEFDMGSLTRLRLDCDGPGWASLGSWCFLDRRAGGGSISPVFLGCFPVSDASACAAMAVMCLSSMAMPSEDFAMARRAFLPAESSVAMDEAWSPWLWLDRDVDVGKACEKRSSSKAS